MTKVQNRQGGAYNGEEIHDAASAAIFEHFADGEDGLTLTIFQARYIAGCILDRLRSADSPKQ